MGKENHWKEEAEDIQRAFKKSIGLEKSGTFRLRGKEYVKDTILHDDDASRGANFFCYNQPEEWEALKSWARKDRGKKVNFSNNNLKHLVRSEHIPYNVFYPLSKMIENDQERLTRLMEAILETEVDEVTRITVEYNGGVDPEQLLEDRTSFDTFIEFKKNGKTCGVGVEVKYTELSYEYGDSEYARLHNPDSAYLKTARISEYYHNWDSPELKTKELKQLFRNHLLGIKMVQEGLLDEFYSLHFFPRGNKYQQTVADSYLKELTHPARKYFIPLTFNAFTEKAREAGITDEWLRYFKRRY